MLKKIFAGVLTVVIIFVSLFYSYNDHELPFKKRYLEFYKADGSEIYMKDMISDLNKTKDNETIDLNLEWRKEGIVVKGHFKVGVVREDSKGHYRIMSKFSYTQAKENPFIENLLVLVNEIDKDKGICLYISKDNPKISTLLNGDEIYFQGKFNQITEAFLMITEGEIL